jgi:hypothetical protein
VDGYDQSQFIIADYSRDAYRHKFYAGCAQVVVNEIFRQAGDSLLGIATSGCAACGLPLLAVLGLSGSVAYLPWHGTELSLLAVALLAVSFALSLRAYSKALSCNIDYENK